MKQLTIKLSNKRLINLSPINSLSYMGSTSIRLCLYTWRQNKSELQQRCMNNWWLNSLDSSSNWRHFRSACMLLRTLLLSLYKTYFQINGEVSLLYGDAGEEIVKKARQIGASLVVTGSRGLGVIRRTVLGSVSDYVLHMWMFPWSFILINTLTRDIVCISLTSVFHLFLCFMSLYVQYYIRIVIHLNK